MRNLLITLLISILSFHFLISTADAKRFGGGRSFGMSRSISATPRPTQSTFSPQQSAQPTNGMSRWLGPLAGFAAGGLLASLFGHGGGGGGFMTILLAAGLGLMLWRLLQNRSSSSTAQFQGNQSAPFSSVINQAPVQSTQQSTFDEPAFLRQAKSSFIRMQTAYDNKNLADLREFTSPAVFAEIQMQLHERGDAANQTDVLNVEAQLLDTAEENNATIASVLFIAQIREQQDAALETMKEIWHFRKDAFNANWVVAGIQQE